MTTRIGDLIDVPSVQTVVRIEEGRTQSAAVAQSFVLTTDVADHLAVLAQALLRDTGQGYFLQGDFGSGKSHFLAALSCLLTHQNGAEVLWAAHPDLRTLVASRRRFLSVDISLVNYRSSRSLESIIVEQVDRALKEQTGSGLALSPDLERIDLFAGIVTAVKSRSLCGMALLIDELSEFFRSKPEAALLNEDARTLQLLGELSRREPLWIVAAVQESIEQTGDIAQTTFRKIKDRFPGKLALSTLHIRDLVAKRLIRHKPGADEQLFRVYQNIRECFPDFSAEFESFRSIYPLHPVTLQLLEGLGELFSQHRGIVDFVHAQVAGDAQRHIAGILEQPCTQLLAPDAIYEHFAARLAEFSAFHMYPRQIVPHLDAAIDEAIEGAQERALAKRIVRILVLYAIHPTAEAPSVKIVAQLAACTLFDHDPAANVQFVSEVLLDPLVARSRFLVKRERAGGALYEVTTTEDHSGTFRARLGRIMGDIAADDTRLVLKPLVQLTPSLSWPGPDAMREPVTRQIVWRHTSRNAVVMFVHSGAEQHALHKLTTAISEGTADFAVAVVLGTQQFVCAHAAVWRLPMPGASDAGALREYCAVNLLLGELRPQNPADAPLIPIAREYARRLEPAVNQALYTVIYGGRFDGGAALDPAALQLKRFDRLVEIAAETVLESRYPLFKTIEPRSVLAGARMYQRLLEDFVVPGTLGMRDTATRGLSEAMETLATPLGLVELKTGSYRLSPNTGEHPFLSYVFGLLTPTAPTPIKPLLLSLRTGPYGVPPDTAAFLLVSLAHCGMITMLSNNRSVPLDYLNLAALDRADSVAPGEIIAQADRDTLVRECAFLAPQGGWESFGLRQQREAWQNLLKVKKSLDNVLTETSARLSACSQYDAFRGLGIEQIESRLTSVKSAFDEVMVSYAAREGLERFLAAWRSASISSADVEFVKNLHRFLTRHAESFIFTSHYLRHRSVEAAASLDAQVAQRRDTVGVMVRDPLALVVPDDAVQLAAAFDLFRECYSDLYGAGHAKFHQVRAKPEPSKYSLRCIGAMRRLASVESLDRPSGLSGFFAELDTPPPAPCKRHVKEELLRAAQCGCGFCVGDLPPQTAPGTDPDRSVAQLFTEYHAILRAPRVREAVTARAYALKDAKPEIAGRLTRLESVIADSQTPSSLLLDALDEHTVAELDRALSGTVSLQSRNLRGLQAALSGRRLTPENIRAVCSEWLGSVAPDAIVAIEGGEAGGGKTGSDASWWPLLRSDLFSSRQVLIAPEEARRVEKSCEELFPAANLRPRLLRLETVRLVQFVCEEPVHTSALKEAWSILAERVLQGSADVAEIAAGSRHLVPAEAAGIVARLTGLHRICALRREHAPQRLRARIALSALAADAWSDQRILAAIEAAVADCAQKAADWLITLPPVQPLDLSVNPVVVLVDGLAPDVWLEAATTMDGVMGPAHVSWARVTSAAHTVPAMNALFGFGAERDPLNEFHARGIAYHQLSGDEKARVTDLISHASAQGPLVIRFGVIDKASHEGRLRLHELPAMLRTVLSHSLPDLLDVCAKTRRPLVLTTDHGMSFVKGRLSHGAGGVFEEAIARIEWRP